MKHLEVMNKISEKPEFPNTVLLTFEEGFID